MVHDLKYRERTQIAELFASLVGQMLDRRRVQVDALVPVPLSPRRASERGFNQAALVATALGTANGVAVIPAALIRTRETPPQVGRTAADRQKNVAGAFSCPEPIRVAGKRLLLIDDVATTGATVTACAEALKAAGAARVYAAVVAREM
ncbi:MAG: phosphoribosyltransferase family protein [Chloroflexota bacterium]